MEEALKKATEEAHKQRVDLEKKSGLVQTTT
jgi:DNA-binding protein YbaB